MEDTKGVTTMTWEELEDCGVSVNCLAAVVCLSLPNHLLSPIVSFLGRGIVIDKYTSNEQFHMYYPITLNILDWIISMCLLIVVLQSDTYIVGNWHAEAIEEFEEGKIVNETKFWFTA